MSDVSDDDAGTPLALLGGVREVHASEFADFYRYPVRLRRCWVRANMIASLDGGATVDGVTAGLGGAGDRALFRVMRELADVVLVGAGTVRAENYSGAQLSVAARQVRHRLGQAEVPPVAVVTASGALDPGSRLFTRAETPPLIFTTAASLPSTRDRLQGHAEVIAASTADAVVDIAEVLAVLYRRGLARVLCEGGPTLVGDVIAAGLLDELALTVAPMLVAGNAPRIALGPTPVTMAFRATHLLTDLDGYLYTLFARAS